MKVLTTLLFSLFTVVLMAQVNPTTQEEYNYITKGYKIQQESGLDMKKGYSLKFYTETQVNGKVELWGDASVVCAGLFRDGEKKPCAMMLFYQNFALKSKDYLCVPSHDADKSLWDLHLTRFNNLGDNQKMMVHKCLAKTLHYLLTE